MWSLALRRGAPDDHRVVRKLRMLIEAKEHVVLIGMIVQEVLQDVRSGPVFDRLAAELEHFPILSLSRADYVRAAQIKRECKRRGVTVSTVDATIAAAAINHDCAVLSADNDFAHIARHVPLVLA